MVKIYIDDSRTIPAGFDCYCTTTNDAIKTIRRKYKEGNRTFFLDLDHDAGDPKNATGGDFINVLKNLGQYVDSNKMNDLHVSVHFHSSNPVGVENMRNICKDYGWEEVY